MPDPDPSLLTIFGEALEQPDAAARGTYLDRVCGNGDLRRRVEALLAAHAGAGRFLEPGVAIHTPPDTTGTFAPDGIRPSERSTEEYLGDRAMAVEGTPTGIRTSGPAAGTVIAGRYTLVEVIGEGGMGTVYRANQTEPVNRQVALKLIKSGMDSRAILARFDTERQALARMDHPNIARVYDGGTTSTGQPFFVMELVNGVPITEYCDRHRLPIRGRLELFVAVCQAVQHAHQKGIIHRDLKPSNVLVIELDDRPTPKVIDFGVAKATEFKPTEPSFADTGAIVGTPAYMSPEQADPTSMDIDTRTDVYALGVILYELLVGSPPIEAKQFQRGAFLEMLRLVREIDPPKPSTKLSTAEALPNIAANRNLDPAQLKRAVRGDLDWIVLKALEKDRTRRYDTANGFAADVLRHLSHEPVLAAPPSRAYRLRKFVRKNRGAVIAVGLVVLVLMFGIAGTTWGLIRAENRRVDAERARAAEAERVRERDEALGKAEQQGEKARRREADAVAARNDLQQANTALLESTDNLLTGAARSLLRPLAVQFQPNQSLPPLNDQEIEPLWELASLKDERLRLRFVEVALRDPISTRRLKDRAAFALQATVGLNAARRTQVEELLSKGLLANEILPEQQGNLALCLVRLGNLDRPMAGRTVAALTQAMSKTTDPGTLQALSRSLTAVAARVEPKDAAATLTQAITNTTNPLLLKMLAEGLSAVAAHMEPQDAARTCSRAATTLTRAITNTTNPNALLLLTEGLAALVVRMETRDAAEAAAIVTQAMTNKTDPNLLKLLSYSLSTMAPHMLPEDAAQACARASVAVRDNMTKTTDYLALHSLSQALSVLAGHMEPEQAAATLTQVMSNTTSPIAWQRLSEGLAAVAARMEPRNAAATLTQTMSRTTNPDALHALAQGLSVVTARMNPKDAAAILTQAITNTASPLLLKYLTEVLSVVTARMNPKDAASTCGQAAATLTQAITNTTDPNALRYLSESLSMLGARLELKDSSAAAATLTQAMTMLTNASALQYLSQPLAVLGARLELKDASAAAATLTQAMTKTTDLYTLQALSQGLSAVVPRLGPKDASEAAATLTQAMTRTTTPNVLQALSSALSMVAVRMEPKEAARVCTQAVAILNQAMTKTTDPDALHYLLRGLSVAAICLEPKEAAATLAQALGDAKIPGVGLYLSQGLAAVAARMEPRDAATTLAQTMSRTTDPTALHVLSEGLSAAAARMEPKAAAAVLTQIMSRTTEQSALRNLSRGLSAVATRLEAKDAAEAADTLKRAMTNMPPVTLQYLAEGVSVVAARMEPKGAALVCGQAAAILAQATRKTIDSSLLLSLSQGLLAVTTRMEPNEAATTLTQAMSRMMDSSILQTLSRGLSAVATRLEPQAAAEVAATLNQTMSKTTKMIDLQSLAPALAAVAERMEPKDAIGARNQAAATLIKAMSQPAADYFSTQLLSRSLLVVTAGMDPETSAQVCGQAAAALFQVMSRTTDGKGLIFLSNALSAVLSRKPFLPRPYLVTSVVGAVGGMGDPRLPFPSLAWAQPALEPVPPPLPPQLLVDLLKHPFCVGEARRQVLEQLARHYNRPFADQWEFVEYVHKHKLNLDLTTPPERPRPAR